MHHTHHTDNHYVDPDPAAAPAPPRRAPLRSTRFAPVKLTEARLDAFHDVAHAALSGTVRAFVQLDGAPIDTQRWRYVRSRGGASVYYERRRADKRHAALLVAGTIKARLADVMEGLYMDSTEHTRLVQHQLAPRFVDAEVLKVIEQRSPAQPFAFTGLKWAAVKASASGMVSSRDFCYLEKVGVIDITGGRKLGYFIMQSVDLPECPPAPSSKALRTNLSLCYLFEETRNGLVGMYMNGSMELAGPKMLWKMSRTNFADIALAVAGAREVAYAKRCAALLRAKKRRHGGATNSAAPKQPRGSVCELCHSLPSFFERHRECAGCDKMSVCKKCRVKHDVLRREHKSSRRLAHATFCFDCMESVKNPTAAGAFSSSSGSSGSHTRSDQPEHEEDDEEEEEPVAPPRGFKPLYDDESPRGYKVYDDVASPRGFNSESISSTFESELFGYDEPEPDSERSLRMFTLKLQQQLEEVGYDELDASSRHEGLAILGSGEYGRDSDNLSCTSDDELTSSSCVSSLLSIETTVTNGTNREDDDDYGDLEDEEEILSVRPVRRSQQPPEMLEAQTLNADGTLRKQSTASTRMPTASTTSPDELTRALLARLEEASLVAEQTYEQLKRSQVFSRSSSRAQSTESSGYTL